MWDMYYNGDEIKKKIYDFQMDCKHCKRVKVDKDGERVAVCARDNREHNVDQGRCFGYCRDQVYSPKTVADTLRNLSYDAYNWHINERVVGMDVKEFELLMDTAADMITKRCQQDDN